MMRVTTCFSFPAFFSVATTGLDSSYSLQPLQGEEPPPAKKQSMLFLFAPVSFLILFAAIVAASLLFIYRQYVGMVLSFLLLLVAASVSTSYKKKIGFPLGGPELVTFGTVVTGVAYGPIAGFLFGAISATLSEIFSASIGPLTIIYIITAGGVGVLAGTFSHWNPLLLGILSTGILLLINQVIYLFIGDSDVKSMTLVYIIINVLLNVLLFATLAKPLLNILT